MERVAAERTGAPHLVLRDGQKRQRILELEAFGERVAIGRSEAAELSVKWDLEVSRVHAELVRLADRWAIADDGLSMNGTYVNHERLRSRQVLTDGDNIRVGETHIVFRDPAQATIRTTVPAPAPAGVHVTPAQRRVLVALCRPFASGQTFATPASNSEVAEELHLSTDAVKGHVRLLFRSFGVDGVERDRRRTALAEQAFATGTLNWRDFDPGGV